MRIAGRLSLDLEDVAALRLEKTADLLQHEIELGMPVAVIVVEQTGAVGDELLYVAMLGRAFCADMPGDVVGDLQTGPASAEINDGIMKIEMALQQGIEAVPGPASVLPQFLIGAEIARLVQALQDLVALAARAVLKVKALQACPVGIEQLVGFQIGDVNKVIKTVKCAGQHETTPTSQGGTGCLEKTCSSLPSGERPCTWRKQKDSTLFAMKSQGASPFAGCFSANARRLAEKALFLWRKMG